MSGYTIILVDSADPSDSSGDFVLVESFENLDALERESDRWHNEIVLTARSIEHRLARKLESATDGA